MKIKQKNEETGEEEEIEVLSPVEVQAKLDSEKATLESEHKKQLEEVQGRVTTFEQEKKDLETRIAKMELDGVKDDHPNFKVLKDALNKKDEDIKAIKTELETDKKTRAADEMDSKIKIAARGNDELEKKIKFHLEKTVGALPENTKEERQTKLEAAYKLAADISSDGPGIFDIGIGGNGRGGGGDSSGVGVNEFSSKEKALGARLGISEADYKKYGGRVSKRN